MEKQRIAEVVSGLEGTGPHCGSSVTLSNGEVITLGVLGARLDAEVPIWLEYLNDFVGLTSFTLAVAIADLRHGGAYGAVGIVVIAIAAHRFSRRSTPTFKNVRAAEKDFARIVNAAVSDRYFKIFPTLKQAVIYWVGMTTLSITICEKFNVFK